MVNSPGHINFNYIPYGIITRDKLLEEQKTNARELETKKTKISKAENSILITEAIKKSAKNIIKTQKAAAKQVEELLKELTQDVKELKQLIRAGFADFNSDMIALIQSNTHVLTKQQQATKIELLAQALELDKQVHIELRNYYELNASNRHTLGATMNKNIFELNVQIDKRFRQLSEQFDAGFKILLYKILKLQDTARELLQKIADLERHTTEQIQRMQQAVETKIDKYQTNVQQSIDRQWNKIRDIEARIPYRTY
jgi:hypothetical protein